MAEIIGSSASETLSGTSGNDFISGLGGDDTLEGFAGNDTLVGGDGKDVLRGGVGDDLIDASGGSVASQGLGDYILPGLGQDTVLGHQGLYEADGTAGLSYGDVSGVGGVLIEVTDEANSSGIVMALGDVIDDTFTYITDFQGTQDNDTFLRTGSDRFMKFAPLGGDDTIDGGAGRNTALEYYFEDRYFDDQGTGIVGDFSTGTVIDTQGNTDTFTNISQIRGSRFDDMISALGIEYAVRLRGDAGNDTLLGGESADQLEGDAGSDSLIGGAGNDILSGGAGNDEVFGGTGNDQYDFAFATDDEDFISERDGGGTDTLNILDRAARDLDFRRSGSLLVIEEIGGLGKIVIDDHYSGIPTERIEILTALDGLRFLKNVNEGTATSDIIVGASSNDLITGAAGDDLLFGGSGNDTLIGGPGNDLIKGGLGNDTYRFAFESDGWNTISEAQGGGTDTLEIVDRDIAEMGIRRSGSVLVIEDPTGPNRIVIEDHFSGVPTNRIEMVQSIDGMRFFKTGLQGTATDDIIVGKSGTQTLTGGGGDDIIVGGGSKDALYGGSGADVFLYAQVSDSSADPAGRDTIYDFSQAEGDRIGLAGIDANTGLVGNNAFVFLGAGGTAGAGTLAYSFAGGNTLVQADVDGGGADFAVLLAGTITLTADDFIL